MRPTPTTHSMMELHRMTEETLDKAFIDFYQVGSPSSLDLDDHTFYQMLKADLRATCETWWLFERRGLKS